MWLSANQSPDVILMTDNAAYGMVQKPLSSHSDITGNVQFGTISFLEVVGRGGGGSEMVRVLATSNHLLILLLALLLCFCYSRILHQLGFLTIMKNYRFFPK